MLSLRKILKPYTETGALNEQINLYGFIDPHAFLTKIRRCGRDPSGPWCGLRMPGRELHSTR